MVTAFSKSRLAFFFVIVLALSAIAQPRPAVAQAIAPVAGPADLEIANLRITPSQPKVGQAVSVDFDLINNTNQAITVGRVGIGLRGPDACKYANPWTAEAPPDPGGWSNVVVAAHGTLPRSKGLAFGKPGIYILEPVYDAGGGQYLPFKNSTPLWPDVLDSGGNRITPACLVVEKQLTISPTPVNRVGVVWAAFTLRNRTQRTITLNRLLAAGRWSTAAGTLGWASPGTADFPDAPGPITLAPGQPYEYLVEWTFGDQGYYFAEPWRQEAGEAGKYYTGGIPGGNRVQYMVGECVISGVPLYLQGQPSTPSYLPNPSWAGDEYGNPVSETIGWNGCHTASAAMLVSYFAQRSHPGFATDPGLLNSWLQRQAGGYDSANGPDPVAVMGYAQTNGVPLSILPVEQGALDQQLCSGNPAVLHVKNRGHFVVAVGRMTVNGQSTYILNDPRFGQTTLQDHDEYGNAYQSARYYVGSQRGVMKIGGYSPINATESFHGPDAGGYAPIHLVVTDPQGRKTGYDPRTNTVWDQIPDAAYTTESIHGPDGSSLGESKIVLIAQPATGQFKIEAIGSGSGSYKVEVSSIDSQGKSAQEQFSGITQPGQVQEYAVRYTGSNRVFLPLTLRTRSPSFPPNYGTLQDLAFASPTDGWAVGDRGTIARWNGQVWQNWPSPTQNGLNAIDMTGPNDAWAAGDQGTILRYSGGAWTVWPSPVNVWLTGVDMLSPTDGWIVGYGNILRWNGSSWTRVVSPIDQGLWSVRMRSPTDGWITGLGLLLRWNGATWRNEYYADARSLMSVDVQPDGNAWTVGQAALWGNSAIFHWTGSSWSKYQNNWRQDLESVSLVSSDNAWAVGAGGLIIHWDGSRWQAVASPTTKVLNAVKMLSASDGWAVGESGTVLHWNGSKWESW